MAKWLSLLVTTFGVLVFIVLVEIGSINMPSLLDMLQSKNVATKANTHALSDDHPLSKKVQKQLPGDAILEFNRLLFVNNALTARVAELDKALADTPMRDRVTVLEHRLKSLAMKREVEAQEEGGAKLTTTGGDQGAAQIAQDATAAAAAAVTESKHLRSKLANLENRHRDLLATVKKTTAAAAAKEEERLAKGAALAKPPPPPPGLTQLGPPPQSASSATTERTTLYQNKNSSSSSSSSSRQRRNTSTAVSSFLRC
mmetsp:Transcript_27003/g.55255  ORF Transcript_27003/g.55255 Transcript_27003/m.55255 type:complete len:257 (+) Transcript_27003:39-809(+)